MSPKARRYALLAAGVILLGTAVGLSINPLKNWALKRLIVSYISKATGQPCSIARVRVAGNEMHIADLQIGSAAGTVVAVDRLVASGDLGKGRLDTITITHGKVRIQAPGRPVVRLTGVDLQATNLAALNGGGSGEPAALVASGDCFELNPLLAERGNTRFLRGRFTLSAELQRPAGGVLDQPIKVAFKDLAVSSKDRSGRPSIYEGGDVEVTARLTGTLADPKLDLSSIPFLAEPPPGRK